MCLKDYETSFSKWSWSVDNTKDLIRKELEIRRNELLEALHFASLEKIFIEERIYKGREFENAKTMDAACEYVDERLTPFYPQFVREVTKDDILRLMEIKMARILKIQKCLRPFPWRWSL